MSERWPGGLISRSAPVVVGPTGGEGGSAPGVWTMNQIAPYVKAGTWPLPIIAGGISSWGQNTNGQLGLGNTTDFPTPQSGVGATYTWSNVSTAGGGPDGKVLAISNGTLWAWGANGSGQLGIGNTISKSLPTQIGALTNWQEIASGNQSSYAIKTDGTLWAWGNGGDGRLGLNNTTNYSSPKQVGSDTTWSKISAGYYSVFAIKTDGTLWTWGGNGQGQLGHNNTIAYSSPKQVGALTNWVTAITTGGNTVLAIKTNGTLWSWGQNNNGQLGIGTSGAYTQKSSPVQIGALTTWSKAYGGDEGMFAIKTDGTLWAWGGGSYGKLGLGNQINKSSPTQVGSDTTWVKAKNNANSTTAIKTDGTLWTWGQNDNYGQLGLNNFTNYSSPKQVGGTWKKFDTGYNYNIAIS